MLYIAIVPGYKMDNFAGDMSDENVHTVSCRFVEGETVEFDSDQGWIPVTVISINNFIFNVRVEKYPTESLQGFAVYIKIKYTHKHIEKQVNVLQTSERLQRTNTNIQKDRPYYKRMIKMMKEETPNIQKMRLARETHCLAAINAIDTSIHRIRCNEDTLSVRSHFATFVKPKTKLNDKTIKSSGPKIN